MEHCPDCGCETEPVMLLRGPMLLGGKPVHYCPRCDATHAVSEPKPVDTSVGKAAAAGGD